MSVEAPLRQPSVRLEVELLTHSAVLRTAVRRAIHAAGEQLKLASGSEEPPPIETAATSGRAAIIDADMPGFTGTGLLDQVKVRREAPLAIVVSDTIRGRSIQRQLAQAGFNSVFTRPVTDHPSDLKPIAREIVEFLSTGKPADAPASKAPLPMPPSQPRRRSPGEGNGPIVRPRALVIGSSTGGPQALISLFQEFRPEHVSIPVLIVQHMPAAFTPILAEHLTRATGWPAAEATPGEALQGGQIRIAPGGRHMIVEGQRGSMTLGLTEDPPVNFCRPSADVLFLSAAATFGSALLCVVLTGMGHDGAEGVKAIKAAGGMVVAQDEATSVVWGMPGAAVATGAVDKVVPLPAMAALLRNLVGGSAAP